MFDSENAPGDHHSVNDPLVVSGSQCPEWLEATKWTSGQTGVAGAVWTAGGRLVVFQSHDTFRRISVCRPLGARTIDK